MHEGDELERLDHLVGEIETAYETLDQFLSDTVNRLLRERASATERGDTETVAKLNALIVRLHLTDHDSPLRDGLNPN